MRRLNGLLGSDCSSAWAVLGPGAQSNIATSATKEAVWTPAGFDDLKWFMVKGPVSVFVVTHDGAKQLEYAGGNEGAQHKHQQVVPAAWLQRVFRQASALQD